MERNAEILRRHEENGVIIWGFGIFIDEDVEIGEGTEILPGCIIRGETKIGKNCIIGPYAVINDAKIGNDSTIGPFVNIRPKSELGKKVRIGNFVEIKATSMGDGSKASHLSYLGDAEIGEDVNIGCGAITVNYDGSKKHKTKVEDEAFIGCNVNLIAPVNVGKEAFVAAGSTITKDVPPKVLAISRKKEQKHIKDWKRP
jgi:bifunctional UDP-N-acetylglucosamine pyrophosphorylase/glucosamine-1-phosphate N-acetyltransferase